MSSRPRHRHPIGPAATVAVLLTLLPATGCGRKGDPLPPLREPDPIAETELSEPAAADSEPSEAEADDEDDDDGETGSDSEPNDGGDDDGTPP